MSATPDPATPAIPPPDDHDWTTVVDGPCAGCGVDVSALTAAELPALIRRDAGEWRKVLQRERLAVARPAPDVWSAVEYGCHVRDVFEVFADRIRRMLSEDDPTFLTWDHEAAALERDYAHAEPARVAYALAADAGKVADMYDRVTPRTADRPGRRSDGVTFTVTTIGRYVFHECTHHLADVARGYEALTQGEP